MCFVASAPDSNQVLAANLRRLRIRLGLSQEAFADRCGLHRTYIGAIERGERNVTLKTLGQIAEGLGVTPLDLLKQKR
jgi:transcriptional regulator with XRE-family HTH domain